MMGLILFYIAMVFNVIALFYAIFIVPSDIINENIHPFMFLVPFPPFLIGVDYTITGYAAVTYFLFLVAAILVSIETIVLREGKSFLRLGKRLWSDNDLTETEESSYDNNGFVLLGELFMANLFFNACFILFLLLIGIETEGPDFDEYHTWELMFALARASVWEEVISRILLIGLPLYLVRVYSGKTLRGDNAFGYQSGERKWHAYFTGGNFEITGLNGSLIVVSSILFALAHMSSWDAYKVIPTLVGGLALGYLFVKKGVHVSILLHFAIDYLTILPTSLDNEIGTAIEIFIGLIVLVLFFLGSYMFYKYASNFITFSVDLIAGNGSSPGSGMGIPEGEGGHREERVGAGGKEGNTEEVERRRVGEKAGAEGKEENAEEAERNRWGEE